MIINYSAETDGVAIIANTIVCRRRGVLVEKKYVRRS